MSEKKKHERIPQVDVLAWLRANRPALHMAAELDRDWIWLVADPRRVRGDASLPQARPRDEPQGPKRLARRAKKRDEQYDLVAKMAREIFGS